MKTHAAICLLVMGNCLSIAFSATPSYTIDPLGLRDGEHTQSNGYRYSEYEKLNGRGQIVGYSLRYDDGDTDAGRSPWYYNGTTSINIGLIGSENTRDDGYKYSSAAYLNEAGHATGSSNRYGAGNVDLGQSTWIFNGAETIKIGLVDVEHTQLNDYKFSSINRLNELGQVSGTSSRYSSGTTDLGESAWLFNGQSTIKIGFTDTEHTRNDGYKESFAYEINNIGQVRGISMRYTGNASMGETAWFYNGATTVDIGLTGTEHTRNDGFQQNISIKLNDAGQLIGSARRFSGGNSQLGRSAWFYDGATTLSIGLTGPEFASNTGDKTSLARELNEAGHVIGESFRYNANTSLGRSAWIYDGDATIEIGLLGPGNTRSDGYRQNLVSHLTGTGRVVGYSQRYAGNGDAGQSVWIYDGASTNEIGLVGSEHTRSDGYRRNSAEQLFNDAGFVSGLSSRYNGGGIVMGISAWLYNGESTVEVGLVEPENVRADGYMFSNGEFLNEMGQLAGTSLRYDGLTNLGIDAWLYDPVCDETFPLQFSVRSNGYAESRIRYLGDDGVALGVYRRFDELDNDLGYRAFYFTIGEGMHDLGSLVEGELTANDWEYLASVFRADSLGPTPSEIRGNPLGQVVGQGLRIDGGQMAYLLTPISADFDNDGDIDGRDFLAWQRGFGKADATLADGDANGDHVVNDLDLAIWQEQYQSGQSLSANAAVPEPNAILLAVIAFGIQMGRRRPAIR